MVKIRASEFIEFLNRHIDKEEHLQPISIRLTTGFSWGPYANKLKKEKEQLLELRDQVENPVVIRWINSMVVNLDISIERYEREHENREASYRA